VEFAEVTLAEEWNGADGHEDNHENKSSGQGRKPPPRDQISKQVRQSDAI